MSRGKSEYLQTTDDMKQHLRLSLKTISSLCSLYDDGHPYIAVTLATEIDKVLTDNREIISLRRVTRFPTIEGSPGDNLAAEHKLIFARVTNNDQAGRFVAFQPQFHSDLGKVHWLPFPQWWTSDKIYRASAAPPGAPPGALPIDFRLLIPRKKRKTLSRFELVRMIRNKLGSHLDKTLPNELREQLTAISFGVDIQINVKGQILSTIDGSLPVSVKPAEATIRQIAHEVLLAFADAAKSQPSPPSP